MAFSILNNGTIGKVHIIERGMMSDDGVKSTITLSPQISRNAESYFQIMEKIFNAASPLPQGKMPELKMFYLPIDDGKGTANQIDTNLSQEQLLHALQSSGLITQEEMKNTSADLNQKTVKYNEANGLRPLKTPNVLPQGTSDISY